MESIQPAPEQNAPIQPVPTEQPAQPAQPAGASKPEKQLASAKPSGQNQTATDNQKRQQRRGNQSQTRRSRQPDSRFDNRSQEARHTYVQLHPQRLVAINVRNDDYSGDYYSVVLDGSPQQQLEQVVQTIISATPPHCQLFVHTRHPGLNDLIRNLPPHIKTLLRQRNISLRTGSIFRLEGFWQDLLTGLGQNGLPNIQQLTNYALHTYSVTDGLQTYAGGVLYGEKQIHAHTVRVKGSDLPPAELEIAVWAVELLGPGKSVELHHHHTEVNGFWEGNEEFKSRYPGTNPLAARIGKAIERNDLRFELADTRRQNVISYAARDLTGRSLRGEQR